MGELKVETVLVKHDLTEENLAEYSDLMAGYVKRIEDLEEDKKAYTANMNRRIKNVQAELSDVAEIVRRGWAERKVECFLVYDYPRGKVRYYVKDENAEQGLGEFVKIRDIKQHEAQSSFDFEGGDLDPVADAFMEWGPFKECWRNRIPVRTSTLSDLDRIEECWFMEYLEDTPELAKTSGLNFSFVDGVAA